MDMIYTCPMHANIKQNHPGDCPICGMALEPENPSEQHSSEKTENLELTDFKRRFWISLIFTIPLLILSMGAHVFDLNTFIAPQLSNYLQLIFATPVVLWGGFPFFKRGWHSIKARALNMFTLISMGTGVALAYSIIATIFPNFFPESMRTSANLMPVYFEVAAMLVVLVLLGQVLEIKAREKTGDAIKALLDLTPQIAHRMLGDQEEDIAIESVQLGDTLRIKPGEKIPVDGLVIEGESLVDESMLTGEAMPVLKTAEKKLIAGTVNGAGVLIIQAERIGADTLLAQMIQLVSKAQRSHAPIQRLADTVSGYFVPIVIAVAVFSWIAWVVFLPTQGGINGLIAAVSVLIIACPCALGLATPMSIMVGIGRAAQRGILIKNAESLEILEKVDTIIFDKTGTLTMGHPTLTDMITTDAFDENTILQFSNALEQNSEHPLANAIKAAAKARNLPTLNAQDIKIMPGQGVTGHVAGKEIMLGNQISTPALEAKANAFRKKGATIIWISINQKTAGFMVVMDAIKPSTISAIKALKQANLTCVMLTGDNQLTANAVAKQLSIDSNKIYAGVLPADKHQVVQKYRDKGHIVAMAGDGINDAPALATADVGIAMGTGTDVAMESAGITLLRGDLTSLVEAKKSSHTVMRNIRQNLFFAFFYNLLGVPLAAGIFYPWFGLQLSPLIAAVAMSLSSLSVVLNALRLRAY